MVRGKRRKQIVYTPPENKIKAADSDGNPKKVPNISQTEIKSVYYEAITSLRKVYTVGQLTKAFGVLASGDYTYLNRPKKTPTEWDFKDKQMIPALYDKTSGTYGAKRIAGTLKKEKIM